MPTDLLDLPGHNRALRVEPVGPFEVYAVFRLNHLQSPFQSKAIRQALLPAIVQADFMRAVMDNVPGGWRDDAAIFPFQSPMASSSGVEPLRGPHNLGMAREKLREAGYAGEKVRLIGPAEVLELTQLCRVGADLFARLGLDLDYVEADMGAAEQSGARGAGWLVDYSGCAGGIRLDGSGRPSVHPRQRRGWSVGWPRVSRLEELRAAWFEAPDLGSRHAIASEMQALALDEVTYLPLGSHKSYTAFRNDLTGRVAGLPLY